MKTTMGKGVEGESAASLEARGGGAFPSTLSLRAALSSFLDELPYLRCPLHTVLQLIPVACGECPTLVHDKAGAYCMHSRVLGGPRAREPGTFQCHSSCQGWVPKSRAVNLETCTWKGPESLSESQSVHKARHQASSQGGRNQSTNK